MTCRNIQCFFQENNAQGMAKVAAQYEDIVRKGQHLKVNIQMLAGFASDFAASLIPSEDNQ
jgi:hypothetical protein